MHVRFLVGLLDGTSGSGAYNKRLIEAFAARGHQVSVIARQRAALDGVTLYHLPPADYGNGLMWRLNLPLSLRRGARQVRRLDCPAPDITIGSEHTFLRGHARKFPGRPWIYFPHSYTYADEIARFSTPGLHRRLSVRSALALQRWAITHADTTVRLSRSSAEGIMDRTSIADPARFTIMPPATWVAGARRVRAPDAPLRFLVAGALHESKRVSLVLHALLSLPADARWECDIVGDGDEREALEALTESAGRPLPIRFHGAKPDLTPFYRAADVLLFPSRLEHAALVLMEAMVHGLPVLALDNRTPGIRTATNEIVDDGETGWLARSDEQFIAVLHRLVADPGMTDKPSDRAFEVAAQRFDFDRHVTRWEGILGEALSR